MLVTADAEWAAFLRAVIARPGDDLPRLIVADWLEERGESGRAEFIRVGCELASHPGLNCGRVGCSRRDPERSCADCAHLEYLRRREVDLLTDGWVAWTRGLPLKCPRLVPDDRLRAGEATATFRRGFVEVMACHWADWRRHASALRRVLPLREVRLTALPPSPLWERLWRRRSSDDGHFVYRLPGLRWRRLALTWEEQRSPVAMYSLWHKLCALYWPGLTFTLPQAGRRPAPLPARAVRAPCARCQGGGFIDGGPYSRRCHVCNGTGWLPVGPAVDPTPVAGV